MSKSGAMTAALLGALMGFGSEFSYLGNSTCNQCKEKGLDKDKDGYNVCDVCPFSAEGFKRFMSEEE